MTADAIRAFGRPAARALSAVLDLPVEQRMEPTGATCVLGITKGCEIMRVHDVLPVSRMCRINAERRILSVGSSGD